MTRLTTLLFLLLGLWAPATGGADTVGRYSAYLRCANWHAPQTMTIRQPGVLYAAMAVPRDQIIHADVMVGPGMLLLNSPVRIRPTMTPSGGSSLVTIGLFRSIDVNGVIADHFSIFKDGVDGFGAITGPSGENYTVFGGRLRGLIDMRGGASWIALPRTATCVQRANQVMLQDASSARRAGIDIVDMPEGGVSTHPAPGDTPPGAWAGLDPGTVTPGPLIPRISDVISGAEDEPRTLSEMAAGGAARAAPVGEAGEVTLDSLFNPPGDGAPAPASEPARDATTIDAVVAEVVGAPPAGSRPAPPRPSRGDICQLGSRHIFAAPGADFAPGFALAGLLRDEDGVAGYQMIPTTDDVIESDVTYRVGKGAAGELAPITLPFGILARDFGGAEPIILTGVPGRVDETGEAAAAGADAERSEKLVRILVIGDGHSASQSGLDRMEQKLAAAIGDDLWEVDWLEITETGNGELHRNLGSFAKFGIMAESRPGKFFAKTPEMFDRLMSRIEEALITEGAPYDRVFWVLEGHKLPHTAPVRLETMLKRVDAKGRLARDSRGNAGKWLEVIAGRFGETYGEGYISGPVKTTDVGYVSVATEFEMGRGVILMDDRRVLEAMKFVLRDKGAALFAAADPVPFELADIVFDARSVLHEIGLLIPRDKFNVFIKATATTLVGVGGGDPDLEDGEVDATSLFFPFSSATGALIVNPLIANKLPERLDYLQRKLGREGYAAVTQRMEKAVANLVGLRGMERDCAYAYLPLSAFTVE